MPDNKHKQWLYKTMKDEGVVVPSYDDFNTDMDDENVRGWYHAKLEELGYDAKSREEFDSAMGYAPATKSEQTRVKKMEQPYVQAQSGAGTYTPGANVKLPTARQSLRAPKPTTPKPTTPKASARPAAKAAESQQRPAFMPYGMTSFNKDQAQNMVETSAPEYVPTTLREAADKAWEYNNQNDEIDRAWEMAEQRTMEKQDRANRDYVHGNAIVPGQEALGTSLSAMEASNRAIRMSEHDIERMAEDAWNNIDRSQSNDRYGIMIDQISEEIRSRYPNAREEDIQRSAEGYLRAKVNQLVWEKAVEMNAPKSATDYFFRKVVGANAVRKIEEGLSRSIMGTTGDMYARELAEQRYEQNGHKFAGVAGTVVGMAVDPMMWIAGGVGSAATKGSMWLGGKIVGEAAARRAATTFAGKVATRAVGGAANFAAFEGMGEALDQYQHGGVAAEQGPHMKKIGEVEYLPTDSWHPQSSGEYSVGDILGKMGHGAVMGGTIGVIGGIIGNVSENAVHATNTLIANDGVRAAAKSGIRTGELGVSTVAEGTIFAVPDMAGVAKEYNKQIASLSDKSSENYIADDEERAAAIERLERKRKEAVMDVWDDSMVMMLGFKAHGAIKSAPKRIAELSSSGDGRRGFVERLNRVLDGSAPELALTKDEEAELDAAGYTDLKELTKDYKDFEGAKGVRVDAETGAEVEGELPYNRFTELMQDGRVSEAARAKMYYYLSGKQLPMSTVMGSNIIENTDENGRVSYTVQSFGANGIITSKTYTSKSRAEADVASITRQAELNSLYIGERYYDYMADKKDMHEACKTIGEEKGVVADMLYDMMQKDPADMSEVEREWAEEILGEYYATRGNNTSETLRNGRYAGIDGIIGKPANKRSEREQQFLKDYIEDLYADAKRESMGEDPISDNGESADFKNGYNATPQEAKDIYVGLSLAEREPLAQAKLQEEYRGVMKRIADECDYLAAMERKNMEKLQHKDDKGLHEVVLNRHADSEEGDVAYIVNGSCELNAQGEWVGDKSVVVYDPATGELKQMFPATDFKELGHVTSAEEVENGIMQGRKRSYENRVAEVTNRVEMEPGDRFAMPDGQNAQVIGVDGDNITVLLGDGTQTSISQAELQRQNDEAAMAYYRERFGKPTEVGKSNNGIVKGAPASYEPGMSIIVKNDDGNEQNGVVVGRSRSEGMANYVEDPNGPFVTYVLANGLEYHDTPAELEKKVSGYVVENEGGEELTAKPASEAGRSGEGGEEPIAEGAPIADGKPIAEGAPVASGPAEPIADTPAAGETPEVRMEGAMPIGDDGNPMWLAAAPADGYEYLYNNSGLERDEANEFVAAKIAEAEKAAKAIEKKKPKVSTDLAKYKAEKEAWQNDMDAAQGAVDYWKDVKGVEDGIEAEAAARIEEEQRAAEEARKAEEAERVKAEEEAKAKDEAERVEEERKAEEDAAMQQAKPAEGAEHDNKNAVESVEGATELHPNEAKGAKGEDKLQLEVAKSAKSMHAKAEESVKGAEVEEGPKSAFDVEESGIPANVRNRQEMLDNAVRAYNDVLKWTKANEEVTFDAFAKQYEENNGSVLAKYDKPYLQGLFDYVSGKLEKLAEEREKKEKGGMKRIDVEGLFGALRDKGEAKLSDHEVEEEKVENNNKSGKRGEGKKKEEGAKKRIVSDDRMDELKERLKKKLNGQLNIGVDPELISIGAELAVGHIERGLTKFAEFAKKMIEEIGDGIRPYLKSFYNAVRDMPEAEDYAGDMDSYDYVSKFDVKNFDKQKNEAPKSAEKTPTFEESVNKEVEGYIADGRVFERGFTDSGRTRYMATDYYGSTVVTINKGMYDYAKEHGGIMQSEEEYNVLKDNYRYTELLNEFLREFPHREIEDVISSLENAEGRMADYNRENTLPWVKELKNLQDGERGRRNKMMELMEQREEAAKLLHEGPIQNEEQEKTEGYTITPSVYTTARGKGIDMHLVKFDRELSKEDIAKGKEIAKESKGWWSAKDGGFLMRDEESAKEIAKRLTEVNNDVQPEAENGEVKTFDAESSNLFVTKVYESLVGSIRDGGEKPFKSIIELRKFARENGLDVDEEGRDDVKLNELVEDAITKAAMQVWKEESAKNLDNSSGYSIEAYEKVCKLYDMQPSINARSSNRIALQQYSTPIPMGFVADKFAYVDKGIGFEPTAGNGMLVSFVPHENIDVNEIDENRLANLYNGGYRVVTERDATKAFGRNKIYDYIISNPPFGHTEAKDYDGYSISGLEHQIAINALEQMKDDGKAAIIIGGNMEYAQNGSLKGQKSFWAYLYDNYNVKGVIDMSGDLYKKQGTKYPTRMILIEGRRSEGERAQVRVYPPVKAKAYRTAETFEDLWDIANEIINDNRKHNGTEILRSGAGQPVSDSERKAGEGNGAARSEKPSKNDGVAAGERRNGNAGGERDVAESGIVLQRGPRQDAGAGTVKRGAGESRAEVRGNEASDSGRRAGIDTVQRVAESGVRGDGERLEKKSAPAKVERSEEKRELDTEKLPYRQHNTAFSLKSVAPASMVEAMDDTLKRIEDKYGNVDEFVTGELGYVSVDEMHGALAAEQVDSVAMAIAQMKEGHGFVIGDQTGVGKGRQMAALIRWARNQGAKPVFFTQKADLFTDIYRDLADVGSADLVPFIVNSDGAMLDAEGKSVYKPLSAEAQKKVFGSGEIPEGYDFVVVTYSQVNTGDQQSKDEFMDAAKKSGQRTSKKDKTTSRPTPKADWIRKIVKGNYLFLDESHTGAGQSNTGYYMQSISKEAKAVTYASATFAKRPDTMPLYAMRTAMSEANVPLADLIGIIQKGGVTLQEIMSRAMTSAGQMVRRERDMSDVRTDWKTIDDPEIIRNSRAAYDRTITAFNAIVQFQETYVNAKIAADDMQSAAIMMTVGNKKGTKKMGIENEPFVSKTYNYTKQLMLALKVDAIVKEVESEIKAGRHPVIALESTMESSFKDFDGMELPEPTFAASLLRGLESVMQYTKTNDEGESVSGKYLPSELGEEGEQAYYSLQDFIIESTADIFISPIDAIIEGLREKGYKVGELTGRNTKVEKDESGNYVVRKRTDKDKKKMQREFNSGELDVLILNKSASTGISLHASSKFSDQRQRSMIMAQPLSDINDYMQMIGRIDRTGQVHRGYYINLGLPIPAESRFMMMLSTKLKSLNANTTSAQDSKSNDVDAPDLLNKYGSRVVVEYLKEHFDIYEKMGCPLKNGDGDKIRTSADLLDYNAKEEDARKITGYVALLSTKEQEDFYNEVVQQYTDLIKYLDDTGANDLKITVMPLRAETIDKKVSSRGTNPDGTNPFAHNAYLERVSMDIIRKPMKADEVKKLIENINGDSEGEAKRERLKDIILKISQQHLDAEAQRNEAREDRDKKVLAEYAAKVNAQDKLTDEQKDEAISTREIELGLKRNEQYENALKRARSSDNLFLQRIGSFKVGKTYLIPEDLHGATLNMFTPAIFCGFKAKEEKLTQGGTLAVFAILNGIRKLEIKLTDGEALSNITSCTMTNYNAASETGLYNWDSKIPTGTRKEGYILTGNILQAVGDTQREDGSYAGQLISYTDMEGNINDGILMPDNWQPTMLKNSGVPINARLKQIKEGKINSIESTDGKVKLTHRWNGWDLVVPKTKKEGAKYFENPKLLSLVGYTGFYQRNGEFHADILEENIGKAVNELANIGVRVPDSLDDNIRFRDGEDVTESTEFKRWFGDWEKDPEKSSKAVDENGKPRVFYHGSFWNPLEEPEGEAVFKDSFRGTSSGDNGWFGQGHYFAFDSREARMYGTEVTPVFLNIRKPFYFNENFRDKINGHEIGSLNPARGSAEVINLSKLFPGLTKGLNVTKYIGEEIPKRVSIEDYAKAFDDVYNNKEFIVEENVDEMDRDLCKLKADPVVFRAKNGFEWTEYAFSMMFHKTDSDNYDHRAEYTHWYLTHDSGSHIYLSDEDYEVVRGEITEHDLFSLPRVRGIYETKEFTDSLKEKGYDGVIQSKYGDEAVVFNSNQIKYVENKKFDPNNNDIREREGEDTVVEKDKETLKALDKEPVEYGYRNVEMREEMDMLSPMGAKLKGNGKEAVANIPFSFLEYERSVEHPELVDENGKIDLVKANGKPLSKVDYNPYIHIRPTKVNYQFAEAWNRPGLIFIKTAYPKSELESGYQADKAKLAVGRHDWNGGELILSRWDKPVGIVPWSEIADDWMAQYGEKGVPFNRLHPMLVPILESRGMKILPPDGNVGAACKEAYESWRENGTLNTKGAIDDARIGEINKMLENRMSNEPRTMREAASEYATKLNANVNIIEDAEGLTGRKAKAKGWYDMSTGEVNVVIGNHKDVGDVIATISHEVIGHKGLRELVGEEGYDAFLDEVYDHLEDALKERVDERWAREHVRRPDTSHEQKRREAVDELLAEMAEKPFEEFSEGERTLWQKIKRKVRELLDKLLGGGKLPGWFKIGDNEIRYMLWRSKEKMERGKEGPIDVARDIVKREELGLDFKDGEDDDTDPDGPGNGGGRPRTAARKGAKEMDGEYMDAVNAGDMEKAGRMVAEAAAKAGFDHIAYHGTDSEFNEFMYGGGQYGEGIYVTNDKRVAEGYGNVMKLFTNPGKIADFGDVTSVLDKNHPGWENEYITDEDDPDYEWEKDPTNIEYFPWVIEELIDAGFSSFKDDSNDGYVIWFGRNGEGSNRVKLAETVTYDNDGNVIPLSKRFGNGDDIRYRDGEEEELKDIMKDGSMGMAEKLTAAKLLIVERNREDAEARRNALRSLGGNLADIRRATGLQKQFDKTTVKRVADLARVMVSSGLFNDIQRGEMRRLLSIVKNSAGKDDLSSAVNTMYDMMLNNNLNTMRGALDKLTKIKAGKVDAKGVEVQGKLDVNGQIMLKAYKKGVGLNSAELEDKIADAMNRMASEDDSLAEEASMEYMGLTIARDFVEGARECLEEIDDIKDMMRHARRDTTEQREYYESLVDAERDAKIDLIESYANVISNLGEAMKGSIERAKSFVEEEKDNAKKIQHFANSDTQGKKKNEHYQSTTMSKIANGAAARALLSPLSTFDQMLRLFGSKSANGEGYLYNHFMRGVVEARTREIKGYREKCAILDDKVRELFGGKVKNLSDLISYIGKMPKMDVMFMDGGSMEPHKLNQGNLMYIYMVDKMSDGRMKLRKMGITSESVEDITNELNPKLRIMADWIQEEFLVDTRNEYNKTHKALFGAPMASIENYFPIKINSGSRTEKADNLDKQGENQSISTTTGSIIKRRRNNLALDLLNANAIEVLVDHIAKMEHWNAYASFNRDLNVLRTFKSFENKVRNMNTVYGSGQELWDNFNRVCRMAAGTYDPSGKNATFDKAIVNINRNVAAAKISFRLWTAIKQLSSIPAFFANARADYMAEAMIAPWKAWEWAMDNLPIFEERWKSRMSGDPRLMKSNKDWKSGRANAVQVASRIGMSPNAFMDALAVSIGSYAIYKTKFGQYKREGFTEDYADKRAKQDAVVAFNQSQQSNEGPFTAPVQVDRTVAASTFTLFRNASMGYQRQAHDALRNTVKTLTPGYRGQSIAFMEKQLMREGLSEEQAKKAATKRYARQVFKNPLNLAIFGWLLPYLWDLMAYAPYLIFGDDDEKKSEMKEDAWQHSKFGWLEGLAGGDVISEGGKMMLMDDINADYLRKELPLTSDLHKMLQKVQSKKYQAVVNDIMNIIVQIGIGVNPQSATDIALAIMDACGNDVELAHEATIMIARIAQVPQSQIEGLYFDEVGLSGDEVSKYTPAELAKRYAEYKVKRGAIYSPWTWEDEDAIEKKEKTSKSLIKERVERLGEKDINDKYLEYEEVYKELAEIQKEAKKWESKDFVRFAQAMDQLKSDKNKYDIYMRFKELDKTLNKLVERYMKAQSGEEAAKLHEQIIEYKSDMVKKLEEGNN